MSQLRTERESDKTPICNEYTDPKKENQVETSQLFTIETICLVKFDSLPFWLNGKFDVQRIYNVSLVFE